jgi:hypothetical protein
MRPILRPERRLYRDEASQYLDTVLARFRRDSDAKGELASKGLTDEEMYLVGIKRHFRDPNVWPMYIRCRPIVVRNFGGLAPLKPALSAGCRRCRA